MAFGGDAIDKWGIIRPFPSMSMLTGLFANALGWKRTDYKKHQDLQNRLIFAARIDREPAGGTPMTDFQTAQLGYNDKGWTTFGKPEERKGDDKTYNSPYIRHRDYHVDMRMTVALRLEPVNCQPTLNELANALQKPIRPLFIGRKSCIPSAPLFGGFRDGSDTLKAILAVSISELPQESVKLMWPENESIVPKEIRINCSLMLTDQRNWKSRLHGGGRMVCEGSLIPTE